ncbi:PAS domain-containing protein [Methylobacterium isbiliense]|uniref:histidine kinase n=1 Tax=Methylobacterium isbiliense TaxID=315478 RepID=A0ABQ4SRQ9_9HYPH|nr:PAS domain-containing protein [Methylobacterium isbiliense]MDN3626467.1 PAS domain-containing protein [Methylobacterium isbiliense]GJE04479.1 Blue-light-activated protein [Methylobacterium isbiliense]
MDQGALEPLGRPGLRHWQQSTITNTDLNERGSVFFAAVEMTRMPMILADPRQEDTPIVFANNAFLDLTGYEEGEVLGRNCRFLQGAGTDPEHVRQLRDAVTAGEAVAVEILNYRRDGTPFWNAVFIGPVHNPEGEIIYFFASQLDVTQRRESEQQFRQAQKMEAIGQLTAGMAHDFNNLLHVINGSLERLAAKRHDELAFERYLAAATGAAERGAKLTHQLLAFARRGRLEPRGVDLSDLVHSVAELLETSIGSKATLHLNLQRRLPQVQVDATHLEMALLNIVVNARDASPNGGAITVTTRQVHLNGDATSRHLKPGDYVLLCVSDEGTGMAAHVAARATEPFFTTKPRGEGTGLGLAMAHGFVQQSGGRLEVESEVGRGTIIRMLFPVFQPKEEDLGRGEAQRDYQARPLDNLTAPPLILVVDDSREAVAMAAEALQEVGYRVVVAHSAEEALERFDEARERGDGFKLVFSDVIMPGGANGLVLAEQVASRDPSVPILLTTGYNDEMAIDGPQPHAMDVLGKPYRRSELIDRVQAALRRGARTGPGRQSSDFGHARA